MTYREALDKQEAKELRQLKWKFAGVVAIAALIIFSLMTVVIYYRTH